MKATNTVAITMTGCFHVRIVELGLDFNERSIAELDTMLLHFEYSMEAILDNTLQFTYSRIFSLDHLCNSSFIPQISLVANHLANTKSSSTSDGFGLDAQTLVWLGRDVGEAILVEPHCSEQ